MSLKRPGPIKNRTPNLTARLRQRLWLEPIENRLAPAVIGGAVFHDFNGDGVRQNTEPGMPNVTVFLDANGDGKFNPPSAGMINDPFTHSGLDGKYFLQTNLTGTFNVGELVPPGFVMTTPTPPPVTIDNSTAQVPGPVFGNKQADPHGGVIHGVVFNDLDGDGVRQNTEPGMGGVIVFVDANNDGKFTPPSLSTPGDPATQSALNGQYNLKVGADGDYQVLEIVPPNFVMTTPIPGKVSVAGGAVVSGPTFGNKADPHGGRIRGIVFLDHNGDGVRQNTEPGMPGVSVFIDLNGDGKYTPGTTPATGEPRVLTQFNGNYELRVAKDGTYSVLEIVPPGFAMTTPPPGPVSVSGGMTVHGPDFGNKFDGTLPGAIRGRVFADLNGDGVRQHTEPGMHGVRVYDDADGNNQFDPGEASTLSSLSGVYLLRLPPGVHQLRQIVPPGFAQTVGPGPITVMSGLVVGGANFGNHPLGPSPFAPGSQGQVSDPPELAPSPPPKNSLLMDLI